MKTLTAILTASVIVICFANGCSKSNSNADYKPKDYTVKIEGTAGLELEMVLMTKPTSDSIARELKYIKVPFTQSLKSVKCEVRIQGEYRGKEGEYSMILSRNGQEIGELSEMVVKPGHKNSGRLGDL